mgnify:CR=1 FL=1
MSLKIDKVTSWAKTNGGRIDAHWGQSLPSPYSNLTFGRSAFGLASDTLGLGKYTMGLSPTDLTDWDAIKDQAVNWGLSKAGSLLTGWLASTDRAWLDDGGRLGDRNLLNSGTYEGYRHNHKIEYKGFIGFSHATEALGDELHKAAFKGKIHRDGEEFSIMRLPFFENPKITEQRNANYASQEIINRNEPYRIWMGSRATKVTVDFNITLPHLLTFASEQLAELVKGQLLSVDYQSAILKLLIAQSQGIPTDVYSPTIPEPKQGFLDKIGDTIGGAVDSVTDAISGFGQDAMDYLFGADDAEIKDYLDDRYQLTNDILEKIDHKIAGLGSTQNTRSQVIVYTMYLIDLIRSSVIGSTKHNNTDPYGKKLTNPPVIFLTYGALYNNDPFIATAYNITIDGVKSGYEELSLIPRVISVKLSLESYDQLQDSQKSQGILKRLSLKS